jgi:hypothetical protein
MGNGRQSRLLCLPLSSATEARPCRRLGQEGMEPLLALDREALVAGRLLGRGSAPNLVCVHYFSCSRGNNVR